MFPFRSIKRFSQAAVAAGSFAATANPARALAADEQSLDQIRTLQQRLTDSGRYAGPIDGKTSEALDIAQSDCPTQQPFLRIETGEHTSTIETFSVDADCSLLVTGSDDKTVRLWSLPGGMFERVIRVPIALGRDGQVYAISLDSLWRYCHAAVAAISFATILSLVPADAADVDSSRPSADEIKALEQRLNDAHCYKGPIDGLGSAALADAIKACPDQRPFLRIEAGMHTGPIFRIGVDAACSLLATASADKTVRVWSLPDGALKRVIRLPIGDGNAGKVYATALSPDGQLLAAGGWDAAWDKTGKQSLTLVHLSDGVLRRFGAFEDAISDIAFSGDGRRVAVGLYSAGVRVLDTGTGAELIADRKYGGPVDSLAFTPDGALIATSEDGRLRRYGSDLKLAARRAAPDGKHPIRVAIDPSGARVAVSYSDTASVSILSAKTMARLASADTADLKGWNFFGIAWSRDGQTLVGTMAQPYFHGPTPNLLRQFQVDGRRKGEDIAVSDNTTMDIRRCGDGFVFGAQDPLFGLLSAEGVKTILQAPRTVDMLYKTGSIYLSANAGAVRFGLGHGLDKPVIFDLAAASLADSPTPPPNFLAASVDGLPVTNWEDSPAPKFKGAKLPLEKDEYSRAFAVRPGASGFVLGTDYYVRAYDAQGKERGSPQASPDAAWGVDFSTDGDIFAVAYSDGTIRWLRWSDGEELLALFVEAESRKWVAWTPSGYFMASAGAEDLIGWHQNRGWDQEADFFPASQFREEYNRPDIVKLVLKTRDEDEAIRQANATAHRVERATPVESELPPVLTILPSKKDGYHFSGDTVEIAYEVRSPSALPVDEIDVLIDGQLDGKRSGPEVLAPKGAEGSNKIIVKPPRKNAIVSLIAHSGSRTSNPAGVPLIFDGPQVDIPGTKPKLFAVLVGVDEYNDPVLRSLPLKYPVKDAEGLGEILKAQEGLLYSNVDTKILVNPTLRQVYGAIEWLKRSATDNDVSMIFLAGHGYAEENAFFYFPTVDTDRAQLLSTAVTGVQLRAAMSLIKGKKVLFIDACNAGAAAGGPSLSTAPDVSKLVNDFTVTWGGLVVYAASMGDEDSQESDAWGHGAFTKALIEAIGEGQAQPKNGRDINTGHLGVYLEDEVPKLTKKKQQAMWARSTLIPLDFTIARAAK